MKLFLIILCWVCTLLFAAILFSNGMRPDGYLQLLQILFFLINIIILFINLILSIQNSKIWNHLPLILFIVSLFFAERSGYLLRPYVFERERPGLEKLVAQVKSGAIPDKITVTGKPGHRQIVKVVGGYFMTAFYAYIWCEDSKPPTAALGYVIDERDKITSRGGGWYEAVVNNGH